MLDLKTPALSKPMTPMILTATLLVASVAGVD
jgi:hypothetical protein